MIKAVMLIVPAILSLAASERFPEYNIEATCQLSTSALDGTGEKMSGCVRDERRAREQIAPIWSAMKAGTRRVCAGDETSAPSYVELLTCVQMSEDAALLK